MNLPLLLSLLTTLILSSQAAEDSQVPDTLEDNFILVTYNDEDEDEFSGSGDDFCSESSGGSGEEEEESPAYSVQSAIYSMTTGGEVGLDIEITLQRMSDSSVEMLCKMKESSALVSVEGSGAAVDSSDNFPATIFLIRDVAVCADLGTAVGKDITTSALKLVEVAGPGEDVETLGVSWPEISQTNCMAILKAGPATSEDATEDGVVVVESRQVNLPRPRPRCVRNKEGILQAAAPTRVFTSLNLASFALVSLGVTGAFTAAAASPAVQNLISNNVNSNGAEHAFSAFFLTVSPVALLVGYYYLATRGAFLRRKFDNFSRRVSNINQQVIAERIDYFQEKVSTLAENVEKTLNFPFFRKFGQNYLRNLSRGPLGPMMRLGDNIVRAMRRSDQSHEEQRDSWDQEQDQIYHYDEDYQNYPSHGYYSGYRNNYYRRYK